MGIKRSGDRYLVESASSKGKFYEVDVEKPFCNCPQYMYRGIKTRTECKHIKAVRDYLDKKGGSQKGRNNKEQQVLKHLRKGPADAMELINKYGDETIDSLKEKGEIIEEKGEVRLL